MKNLLGRFFPLTEVVVRTAFILSLFVNPFAVYAAYPALDNAANPGYTNSNGSVTAVWTNGSNGGTGWQPWVLTPAVSGPTAGFTNISSTANGSPGIDTGAGFAWGMYADGGETNLARRLFTNSVPMRVGQEFSVHIAPGPIDPNGTNGFRLVNSVGVQKMQLYITGADFAAPGGGIFYIDDSTGINSYQAGGYTFVNGFQVTFVLTNTTSGYLFLTDSNRVDTTPDVPVNLISDGIDGVELFGYSTGAVTNFFNYLSLDCGAFPASPAPESINGPVFCVGETVQLTNSTPFDSTVVYHWAGPDGFNFNNYAPPSFIASMSSSGVYSNWVSANGCVSATNVTSVTVAAPAISFSPALLPTFGDVIVGTTSSVQSVTIQNTGSCSLDISSLSLDDPDDFLLSSSCATIPGGGSCSVDVYFKPNASGNRSANIVVTNNAAGSPHFYPLKGAGIAPVIVAVPSSVNFGTQTVNVVSAPHWVEVFNTGDGPLTITGLSIISTNAPDFNIDPDTCLGLPIQPGDSCSIGITFRPGAALPRTATLVIDSTGTNGQQRVALSGVGSIPPNAPLIFVNQTSLSFDPQFIGSTSTAKTVFVSNIGNTALTISVVELSGLNPGDFSVGNNTCGTLLPNEACQISVQFAPLVTVPRSAVLLINSDATNGQQQVALSGTGIANTPAIGLSATSVDFGVITNTSTSQRTITISNTGSASLVLGSLGVVGSNSFSLITDGCSGGILPPSGTCNVILRFSPTSDGTHNATLQIPSNVAGSPTNVALSGSLVSVPALCLSATQLDFGQVPPGITNVQSVTFSNCASTTINITSVTLQGSSDFTLIGPTCTGASLAPGAICTNLIGFSSLSGGSSVASLIIVDNTALSPRTVSLTGNGCSSITITPSALPSLTFGVAYSQLLSATGGVGPYTFGSVGSLPPGLTLSPAGVLSGTPTTVGTSTFTVQASDENGCSGSKTYSVTVSCDAITLTPVTLANPILGKAYTQTIAASSSTGVSFVKTAGTMPPGLTLASTGVLSGTPTLLGSFTFKVSAINDGGCTGERNYSVIVGCPTIAITPATLPIGEVGTAYGVVNLTASGGAAPYVFTQTGGSLPANMTMTSAGVISGTPISGSSVFTVTATDANGCRSSTTYTLVLGNNCPAITVAPVTLANGSAGTANSQTLTASGGGAPYRFSMFSGALPGGMSLSTAGVISGAPTTTGTVSFTVAALDASGCAGFQAYSVTTQCGTISLTPATLAAGTTGVAYSQTISATGGVAPRTYAVTGGTLPNGVTLAATGALSGTPTTAGTFAFTVTATDTIRCTGSQLYSLVVVPAANLGLTMTAANSVAVSSNLTYSLTITNLGPAAATSVVLSNVLPLGVNFVSDSSGCGALNGIVVCNLGVLASGAGKEVSIVVTPTTAGVLTNSAAVSSAVLDLNSTNNSARAITTVIPVVQLTAATQIVGVNAGRAVLNVTRAGNPNVGVAVQYATNDGTGVAGTDYVTTTGSLNFAPGVTQNSIAVPLLPSNAPGNKTVKLNLHNPTGGATLGNRSVATIEIVHGASGESVVFTDSDGDEVTVSLAGGGQLQVDLVGDHVGPIQQITINESGSKSSLNVKVKRGAAGNGQVSIGSIVGAGSLKSLNAKAANLTGPGISLGGTLGKLTMNTVSDARIEAAVITSAKIALFRNSWIVAGQIGKVQLTQVTIDNGGLEFGVQAQSSIGGVTVKTPAFKWSRAGGVDQANGDFHVKQ